MSEKTIIDKCIIGVEEIVCNTIDQCKEMALQAQQIEGVQKKEYWQGFIDALVTIKKVIQPSSLDDKSEVTD